MSNKTFGQGRGKSLAALTRDYD